MGKTVIFPGNVDIYYDGQISKNFFLEANMNDVYEINNIHFGNNDYKNAKIITPFPRVI